MINALKGKGQERYERVKVKGSDNVFFRKQRNTFSINIYLFSKNRFWEGKKKTPHKVIEQGFRSNQISSPMEASEGLDVLNLLIMNFP